MTRSTGPEMNEPFQIPVKIPDGQYTGRWGGYEINFEHDGQPVNVRTKIGVRGINIPCTFRIVDGKLDDESVETTT